VFQFARNTVDETLVAAWLTGAAGAVSCVIVLELPVATPATIARTR